MDELALLLMGVLPLVSLASIVFGVAALVKVNSLEKRLEQLSQRVGEDEELDIAPLVERVPRKSPPAGQQKMSREFSAVE